VLDVGCGAGVHLKVLKQRGLLCSGLEAGPVMAKAASDRLGPQVEVEVGDGNRLPYEDNSFDAVILVNTLELVQRRAKVLAEAARVAASRVCLVTFNLWSPGYWWLRLDSEHFPYASARPLTLWSLRRLVREVLGPVPMNWASALSRPWPWAARWPLASLVAVSAAVTPRFLTRPLTVVAHGARQAARPAPGQARVTLLNRLK